MKNTHSKLTQYSIYLVLLYIAVLGGTTSCVSPKSIVYFQGDTLRNSSQNISQNYIPTIQTNDLLSIVVGSLNSEANEMFNIANTAMTASSNYSATSAGAKLQPVGYMVDTDGNVEIPLIGKVKVRDLKTSVAADTIRMRLTNYLKEPSVVVRTLNFKVSVLGEVAHPAIYVIPDETISLPEVLSLAGDLTIYGKRDNVMIIREEKGVRQYARLDLTSRDIFTSPYYYLHKNDVIYIEPVKTKLAATDRRQQLVPVIASIVGGIGTLGILIINLTK
ncbi:polysaccharide biosynthesis/export family protein [Dyadobacter sp. CY345]|uniref:polysaccharide biosynthesis/export family protein n=1 Tax=Dyadobacter sp. CY345 TaxID=2909335 RepID=UPI001F1661ED|nr:polysaccharide biosynthesis/export family protein [Dyadobacter sp. CY345]MCF2447039.1 polysaccharide biosynthesis/export family protein [Dyadobacter sp. CY345]